MRHFLRLSPKFLLIAFVIAAAASPSLADNVWLPPANPPENWDSVDNSSKLTMPQSSNGTVMFAQIHDGAIPNKSVLTNIRPFEWGSTQPVMAPGVFTTYDFPSMRDNAREHDVAWYQANHPDWVVYQCDQKTPATEYIYSSSASSGTDYARSDSPNGTYWYYMPLDFTNPEVRDYIMQYWLAPAMAAGYNGIGLDNVNLKNIRSAIPSPSGTTTGRCGVFNKDGVWVPEFSGKEVDDTFANAVLDYIGWIKHHVNKLGGRLMINGKIDMYQDRLNEGLIYDRNDIWLEEGGFSACNGSVENTTVTNTPPIDGHTLWDLKYIYAYRKGQIGGYVSLNYICEPTIAQLPAAEVSWIMANYLLVKGPWSYLAIQHVDGTQNGGFINYEADARFNPAIGSPLGAPQEMKGVYARVYSGGVVAVNPTSKTLTLTLPSASWSNPQTPQQQTIVLQPVSGVVLLGAK